MSMEPVLSCKDTSYLWGIKVDGIGVQTLEVPILVHLFPHLAVRLLKKQNAETGISFNHLVDIEGLSLDLVFCLPCEAPED